MHGTFFTIILILLLNLGQAFAGTDILRPTRSENALLMSGPLDLDLLAKLVLEETNRFRSSHGRAALVEFEPLRKAAQGHANAMAKYRFFAHRNPHDRSLRTLSDRIQQVGLQPRAYAENIALTYSLDFRKMLIWDKKGRKKPSPGAPEHSYRTLAQSVTEQWINSPGHRENLLGKSFANIGMGFSARPDTRGYEKVYCVQTFSAPDFRLSSRK